MSLFCFFFFSSRRRHTRLVSDWSSDVCSSDLAFPAPGTDVPDAELHPKVTSSSGNVDASVLADGDFTRTTALHKAPVGQQAWVQFEFAKPQTIRALTFALGGPVNPFQDVMGGAAPGPDLEASEDGVSFRKVSTIPNNGARVH